MLDALRTGSKCLDSGTPLPMNSCVVQKHPSDGCAKRLCPDDCSVCALMAVTSVVLFTIIQMAAEEMQLGASGVAQLSTNDISFGAS